MSPVPPPPIPPELQEPPNRPGRHASRPSARFGGGDRSQVMIAGSVAMSFGYAVIGCALLGGLIDWVFNTTPVWLMTLSILGLIGGAYRFVKDALHLLKANTPPISKSRTPRDHPQDDQIEP
ncbi:MAG: AtpZ/AtpI family protein [Planctomycetota bacterium]